MNDFVWCPDLLGNGFEMSTVKHPGDYSGPVVSTVIKRKSKILSKKGVLYIHGFSDYFFQKEMAYEFNSHGYNFYAVDLRKYGRSHLAHQRFFEVRSITEYFPDISSALDAMRQDGISDYVLAGHSTGGLIASLYIARTPSSPFGAMILNSPFLSWNLPWYKRMLIPLLSALGRKYPAITVAQPKDTRYARSLRKGLGGEWEYDTAWKPDQMPDVDTGWVRAIETAQKELARGAGIEIPILVLTSSSSAKGSDPAEKFNHADGVLDVRRINRAALRLGPHVTEESIDGGLHDLALSRKDVRERYYSLIFRFLSHIR